MGKVPVSKIGELRRRAELTQRQLADEVGVTESTISNWEQGRNSLVWLERIAKLCRALQCTPEDLIDYVEAIDSEGSSYE